MVHALEKSSPRAIDQGRNLSVGWLGGGRVATRISTALVLLTCSASLCAAQSDTQSRESMVRGAAVSALIDSAETNLKQNQQQPLTQYESHALRYSPVIGIDGVGGTAPVISYNNGQLTINAEKETLADVLRMISEKTGARIEIPPDSGSERIVEHMGPGPATEVLTHLLNGSRYNFVVLSSLVPPYELQGVLLFVREELAAPITMPAGSEGAGTPPAEAHSSATRLPDFYATPPPRPPRSREEIEKLMKEKARWWREHGGTKK